MRFQTIGLYSMHGAIVASDEHVGAFVKGLRDVLIPGT